MHVVERAEPTRPAPAFQAPTGDRGQPNDPAGSTADDRLRQPLEIGVDADVRLQDLVIALLLKLGGAEIWPEPGDFESPSHREILKQLHDGPPWPDVATATHRLSEALGDTIAETLQRVQARDEENERITIDEVSRELDVRRLELRKHRLFRQHQALVSALAEEGEGLNAAERQESHARLARIAASIGETIAAQQRLGVVGTASWSIRRGQEVLGG